MRSGYRGREGSWPRSVVAGRWRLKKGHYALICNLPGHYQGGMHADFTVR